MPASSVIVFCFPVALWFGFGIIYLKAFFVRCRYYGFVIRSFFTQKAVNPAVYINKSQK
ncbi:hypothetical protein D3C85_1932420 [compost metagenome]